MGTRRLSMKQISSQQQGILMVAAGIILLLHALGVLQRVFGIIIVIGAVALIFAGIKTAGWDKPLMKLFKQEKKQVRKEVEKVKERRQEKKEDEPTSK